MISVNFVDGFVESALFVVTRRASMDFQILLILKTTIGDSSAGV
jgi:hypothetical protein